MTNQDTALWKAFQSGDRQAFECLLNQYYRALFDYGNKFIKDRDQLKDCVHDLFVNLWERRHFLGEVQHIRLYLCTALRHAILKEKQQQAIWEKLPDSLDEWDIQIDSYVENQIMEHEKEMETQSNCQKTLERLTKRQQEILHLKFYQDLSNQQIAELLTISRPAAANLLSIAIKSFHQQWELLFLFLLLYW